MRAFDAFPGKSVRLLLASLAVATFSSVLAAPASADIFVTDVEFTVANPDTVWIAGTSANYEDVYSGQLTFTTGPNSQQGTPPTIPVWCIDIYHNIGVGGGQNIDYTIGTLSTDNDGHTLSQQQINAMSWLIVAGDAYLLGHATPDVSGAIQLALWELEYSTTYGGTGFSYSNPSSANMVTLMNAFLASAWANNNDSSFDSYVHTLDNSANVQGFAYESGTPTNPPSLVPEPATLGLLGSALLGLAGVRARRRRKNGQTG